MKTPFFTTALAAGLGLLLALLATGCDNPAGENDNNTAVTTREAVEEFYAAHSGILEKPAGMLVLDDEEAINAARQAYGSLSAETRALLSAEKACLDILKAKMEDLKSAAETGAFYTLHDLEIYLAAQSANDAETPYSIVYMGNETTKAIYRVLATAERYVDLNLGGSGVPGFIGGAEEGRAFIVSLILPDSLVEIQDGINGGEIFVGFDNLKSVYAAGVQKLGAFAFAGCPALAQVSLPAALSIGDSAFRGCLSLASVNLPAAITIGSNSFYGCTGLTRVNMPAAISIGDFVFRNCGSLTTINLPAAVSIGIGAFRDCGLTSISLPTAASLGNTAFQGCAGLTGITLPSVISIGMNTFYNCIGLVTINLSAVVSIGQSAFNGCASLTTVSVPKAVSLDMGAFRLCSSLETVSLPSATSIGQNTFYGCASLTTVTLGAVPPTIGNSIFSGTATAAKTITIKTPYPDLYANAGTPWSDKLGNNGVWVNFWDSSNTAANLTVALAPL
jgi:hypothetical protein